MSENNQAPTPEEMGAKLDEEIKETVQDWAENPEGSNFKDLDDRIDVDRRAGRQTFGLALFGRLGPLGRGAVGDQGGEVIKKIPPLIMNHGLLAIGAYAFDEKNRGYKAAVDAIAEHLADKEIGLLPKEFQADTQGLMDYLCNKADSFQLKQCTAEAIAWLNYARRFVKKN